MVRQHALWRGEHLAWFLGVALLPALTPAPGLAQAVIADAPVALMLGKPWQNGQDPAAFLISEKLDGVRAYWDGRVLRFRSGRPIAAPAWFTAALPTTALDGELWLARGSFDRTSAIVRRTAPIDAEWHQLHYMIFDLPGAAGTFAERSARATALLREAGQAWLQPVTQSRLPHQAALTQELQRVVRGGGEGLMLHRADALWLPGRSDALRKLKLAPDEEGRVVAHLPGRGRHAGRLGALLIEMPDGQRFALGTGLTDALREAPPAVGTVVSYRYRDRTSTGLPRFASFLRVQAPE